jgi:hypothetical protein
MKKVFFTSIACMGLWLGSCQFEPLPIEKFDRTLQNLDPTFDKLFLEDLVQLSNKDIIAGGRVLLKTGKFDGLLVRLNPFGDVKEVAHFDSGNLMSSEMAAMAMDENENIYLAGRQRATDGTFKGLLFKISTQNRFEKCWQKIGETLGSRTNYTKLSYKSPHLTIMRSHIIGPEVQNGIAGYLTMDTAGVEKSCNASFAYYDVHSVLQVQNKIAFGGVSYLSNPAGPSVVTLLDPNTCTKTHRTSFGRITETSEFNIVSALSAAPDGTIYTIVSANQRGRPDRNYYFRPFFFKLKPDANLTILNGQTADIELQSDTVMQKMSCSDMHATNDNGFIYALNYSSVTPDSFYTKIWKRNSTFPTQVLWENPLFLSNTQTKKIVPIDNNEYLVLCGRNLETEVNRVIKINSKGIVE